MTTGSPGRVGGSDIPVDHAPQVRAAAIRTARASYGRLVAVLAAQAGDLAAAEDALADAFERALRTWPETGVPDSPEGWLLAVARNRLKDGWKSAAHRTSRPLDDAQEVSAVAVVDGDPDAIPDRRLELLFACAHPAIDAAARAPLMLQVVLGFEAVDLARLYVVSPAAMAQRLVRAKKRIKRLRVPFVVPDRSAVPERLAAVLDAVYGCFTLAAGSDDPAVRALGGEAEYLAGVLAHLLGNEPEAWSLLALITLSRSRERPAGAPYLPLDQQDPDDWDSSSIARGEDALRRAVAAAPGRFQLEAAIQAVHTDRRRTGRVDWGALETLHRALLRVAPTIGSRVALAGVVLRTSGGDAALVLLDAVAGAETDYQPWYAVRAEALVQAGRVDEALDALDRAIALCTSEPARMYLLNRRREICPS